MTSIEKISKIARIKIQTENINSFQKRFDQVVSWVSEVQKIDCSKFEPMIYVNISDYRTYSNDNPNSIKAESTDDILYNNRLHSGQEEDNKNFFKTILVVDNLDN